MRIHNNTDYLLCIDEALFVSNESYSCRRSQGAGFKGFHARSQTGITPGVSVSFLGKATAIAEFIEREPTARLLVHPAFHLVEKELFGYLLLELLSVK
jgi:hypothetical protein